MTHAASPLHRLVAAILLLAAAFARPAVAQPAPTATPAPAARKAVVVTLDGPIVEQRDPLAFLGAGETTMVDLTETMSDAAKDARVGGMVLYFVRPSFNWAQAAELRDAVGEFRKAGKPVLALGDSFSLQTYLVACAADRVATTPVGGIDIYGMSMDMYFFKDLLGKLGLEAQAVHTGKFKTAMEPFTDNAMSEGSRIQMGALLADLSDYAVDAVAASRKLERDDARDALWGGPYTSARALEKRLVDDVAPLDPLMDDWLAETGLEADYEYGADDAKPEMPSLFSMLGSLGKKKEHATPTGPRRIAVVYAVGPIVDGYAAAGPFESEQVVATEDFLDLVAQVLDENDTAAVVVRVDSPGGSAIASDRIWQRLRSLSEEEDIPVVASMGGVAASGGYYISMAADRIVAEPTTITGSIGVVGGRLILGETYRKIGVAKESLTVGPHAGLADETRPWNEAELKLLDGLLVDTYDMFTSRTAESRGKTQDDIRKIAEGRVWTGKAAVGIGLVDELGGLDRAIAVARSLSGEPNAEVIYYPREKTFLEFIEDTMAGQLGAAATLKIEDPALSAARETIPARHLATLRTMMTLMSGRQPAILAVQPMVFDVR